jgi:hypothetical protein
MLPFRVAVLAPTPEAALVVTVGSVAALADGTAKTSTDNISITATMGIRILNLFVFIFKTPSF